MRTYKLLFTCVLWALLAGSCASEQEPEPGLISASCLTHEDCRDAYLCNGEELCLEGRCVAGAAPKCDDQDACTLDGCNESEGCVHLPVESAACLKLDDSGVPDAEDAGPILLAVPSDPAAPPEVACKTSASEMRIYKEEHLAAYRGIQCIEGAVEIQLRTDDLSALSQLQRVGSLRIEGPTDAIQQLTSLVRVDGAVILRGYVTGSEGLGLPALRWVGATLTLSGQLAESGAFPALTYVGGDLELPANMPETTDAFPVLAQLGGSLSLYYPQFPTRALESIGQDLVIHSPGVGLASLQKLRVVGGSVRVNKSGIADILSLPKLERVNGTFELFANAKLSRIDLPKLRHVGSVDIRYNPLLSRCTIDTLLERLDLDNEGEVCCNLACESCAGGLCSR